MLDVLSVVLLALSLLLLLQACGVTFFIGIFGRDLTSTGAAVVRRLGVNSALLALACVAGQYGLEAARMAGEFAGTWDASMQASVMRSSTGAAFALRVLGLLSIAVGLRRRDALAGMVAIGGAVIALVAFLLVGHTAASLQRWILAPILLVHLLIVAFWVGSLLPLYLSSRRETPEITARVVARFSAIAIWWIPGILLTGLAMTTLLVPSVRVFREPYGLLLLAKLTGFVALMVLATLNRWRFGPAIAQGSAAAFQRTVLTEYLLIFAVIAVTAVMTTFFSPD